MKFLKTFISWIVGIFLFIAGIASLFTESAFRGVVALMISMLIIPSAVNFITKTGIALSFKRRIIPIFLLFIILGISLEREEKKENIEYFSLNKTSVINEIRKNIDEGNFDVACDSSEKYLVTNDPDLKEIYNLITQTENEKRENELVAEVQKIPASEYRNNLNIYKELSLLNPSNNEYREKLTFYTDKYSQQIEEEELVAKRQEKIENTDIKEPEIEEPYPDPATPLPTIPSNSRINEIKDYTVVLPPHKFSSTSRVGRARSQIRAVIQLGAYSEKEIKQIAVRLADENQVIGGAYLVQFFDDKSSLQG